MPPYRTSLNITMHISMQSLLRPQVWAPGCRPPAPPGAAQHAGQVVQNGVALALLLKELHIGVEQVTLGDVDALGAQLVD